MLCNRSVDDGDYSEWYPTINECILYGALGLQYLVICSLVAAFSIRCYITRKRKRRSNFEIPSEHMPAHEGSKQRRVADVELTNARQILIDRISGEYSVIRLPESYDESLNQSNKYTASSVDCGSDKYSKLREKSHASERTNHEKPYCPLHKHLHAHNEPCEAARSVTSTPPPLPDQPPPKTKPIQFNLKNKIIYEQKAIELRAAEANLSKIEDSVEQKQSVIDSKQDDDQSSTYSMVGEADTDEDKEAHYTDVSHKSSSDLYSLAGNSDIDHEPADYEEFYSVPDAIETAGSSSDENNFQKSVEPRDQKPRTLSSTEKRKKPTPPVRARGRSASNIEVISAGVKKQKNTGRSVEIKLHPYTKSKPQGIAHK